MTTFGVGELSAINAIAGAYAEFVPVVHIVGTPSTGAQHNGALMHHTVSFTIHVQNTFTYTHRQLGNGDYRVFADMHKKVTIAQANLSDPATAPTEIDRVLRLCYVECRPVYIELPADMVRKVVDGSKLDTPLDVSTPLNDPEMQARVQNLILDRLYQARQPIILVDAGASRHRLLPEVDALVRKTGLPTFVAPMGKSTVNETLPNFIGTYAGDGSHPLVRKYVEESDLVLTIGNVKSDVNTSGFTVRISTLHSIDLHYDCLKFDYAQYDKLHMKWVLQSLTKAVDVSRLPTFASIKRPADISYTSIDNGFSNGHAANGSVVKDVSLDFPMDSITHSYLWPRISSWLKQDDIVVVETGTSSVGIWEARFPPGLNAISQPLWSSIGFGIGATQGAALAAKELGKGQRTISFEGDGSFQLTMQELSTIIAHDLRVTMFLVENSGFTIERWIHGFDEDYNDRPQWRYSEIPKTMVPVGSKHVVKTWKITTRTELEELLNDEEFAHGEGLQFVEMHMPREDAPEALKMVCRAAAKNNA